MNRIKKYFKNSLTNPRVIKFAIVGASGVIVNMGLLYVFTEYFKLYYMLSSVIAIELSIITNFVLNDIWTWNDRTKQIWIKRVVKYHFVSMGALVANWLVLVGLTEGFGIYYMLSNLIGICTGMIINFVLNDLWTFKERPI